MRETSNHCEHLSSGTFQNLSIANDCPGSRDTALVVLPIKPIGRKRVTEMAQQWFTIQQVMEELGVARSTIDKWRRDGNFPKFRKYPNGSLRVEQAAVELWRDSLELV